MHHPPCPVQPEGGGGDPIAEDPVQAGCGCVLHRVGFGRPDEPFSIEPGVDEGEVSIAAECAEIPVDDRRSAVVLVEENVRRREIDMHEVNADRFARLVSDDAKDPAQDPATSLTMRLKDLAVANGSETANKT